MDVTMVVMMDDKPAEKMDARWADYLGSMMADSLDVMKAVRTVV